jgi:Tetratricopeptide repeat
MATNPEILDPQALELVHRQAHSLEPAKPREAEPLFRQALEGYRRAEGPDGNMTLDLTRDLADLLYQSGRGAEAEPLFRAALDQFRQRFGPGDPRVASILAPLGQGLIQQARWVEAEPILRECLAIREKSQPDAWNTFSTPSLLGGSLLGQKKYAEAEPLIVSGYEGMKAREAKIPRPASRASPTPPSGWSGSTRNGKRGHCNRVRHTVCFRPVIAGSELGRVDTVSWLRLRWASGQ